MTTLIHHPNTNGGYANFIANFTWWWRLVIGIVLTLVIGAGWKGWTENNAKIVALEKKADLNEYKITQLISEKATLKAEFETKYNGLEARFTLYRNTNPPGWLIEFLERVSVTVAPEYERKGREPR